MVVIYIHIQSMFLYIHINRLICLYIYLFIYQRRNFYPTSSLSLVNDQVYGYKVVELEKKNQFIMINTLMMNNQDDDDLLLAPTSNSEVANIGLVTAILAGIFMSGQVMQEGNALLFS